MIKVLTVFGTRPEAIKLAPVIREFRRYPKQIMGRVCVTAQHREMLDQVLNLFEIIPDYDLNLMQHGQTLSELTARILVNLDPIITLERPDWILVQGDTTTVMAASLAAFHRQVKVGHVEAGLRTSDRRQPFPEEINRRIASVVADLHFAPTETARENLIREGINPDTAFVTGNTVTDALQIISEMKYDYDHGPLVGIPWHKRIILVTAHRRENFGAALEQICLALKHLAERFGGEIQIVFPVHLNPNVQEPVNRLLNGVPNILLIPPLDYFSLVQVMKRCYLVMTDSGGIQEEAPSLGKPVLVLRDTTERPEAIQAGAAILVGTDANQIIQRAENLLVDECTYQTMAKPVKSYGDGFAARRIYQCILNYQ